MMIEWVHRGRRTQTISSRIGTRALSYFVAINLLRIAILAKTSDNSYFQADYVWPPLFLWIAEKMRFPRVLAWGGTFFLTIFVLSADVLTAESQRFHWGIEAIPQFLGAYHDLPWSLILPVAAVILTVAVVATTGLFAGRRRPLAIWPLVVVFAVLSVADLIAGTGRYRAVYGNYNILTAASQSLVVTYAGMMKEPSVTPIRQGTMYSNVASGNPPAQILSVAFESYGLAWRKDRREALIAPLLKEVSGLYVIDRASHHFQGNTFQGEVRELCGLQMQGYPRTGKVSVRARGVISGVD